MIVFCFLTYNDIIPIHYWNHFFENIPETTYKVLIHPKTQIQSQKYQFPVYVCKNKIVTKGKAHISIVRATIQLFKEAFEYWGDSLTHIIFCSQNCIPLYDFSFYQTFLNHCTKSIVSYIEGNKKERFFQLHEQLKKYINYRQFVKQQPNMILVKKDIQKLINADFTSYFEYMECPDEHYFINVLLYVCKSQIIKSQTHFCNFDLKKTQAIEFKNINSALLTHIKKNGFLFMRKVNESFLSNII